MPKRPPTNYERGRAAEYRATAALRKLGYLVTRSASSKGAFDLVAVGPNDIRLVQVKLGRAISRKEFEHLKQLSKEYTRDLVYIEVWWYPGNRQRCQVTRLE